MACNPQLGSNYYFLDGCKLLMGEVQEIKGNICRVFDEGHRTAYMLEKTELFDTIDDVFDFCEKVIELRNSKYGPIPYVKN